jgi:hypothetical protein
MQSKSVAEQNLVDAEQSGLFLADFIGTSIA